MFQAMRWGILIATLFLAACTDRQPDAKSIAEAQSQSWIGPTSGWKLPSSISRPALQRMRDRAYSYCFREKPGDRSCFTAQDHSLFEYARSFGVVENFRSQARPTSPFAIGHKRDPAALRRVHSYCQAVYNDQGSGDARSLGPCMSAGIGYDFFGVTLSDH